MACDYITPVCIHLHRASVSTFSPSLPPPFLPSSSSLFFSLIMFIAQSNWLHNDTCIEFYHAQWSFSCPTNCPLPFFAQIVPFQTLLWHIYTHAQIHVHTHAHMLHVCMYINLGSTWQKLCIISLCMNASSCEWMCTHMYTCETCRSEVNLKSSSRSLSCPLRQCFSWGPVLINFLRLIVCVRLCSYKTLFIKTSD